MKNTNLKVWGVSDPGRSPKGLGTLWGRSWDSPETLWDALGRLPEALGGLCLAIGEPVEIEVDRTALLVRIILGLMTTEGMESSTRLVTESRGFDAAKRLC